MTPSERRAHCAGKQRESALPVRAKGTLRWKAGRGAQMGINAESGSVSKVHRRQRRYRRQERRGNFAHVPGHGQCLIFLSFIPVFLKLKILNSYGKGLLLLV